jgi:hypothetical protein
VKKILEGICAGTLALTSLVGCSADVEQPLTRDALPSMPGYTADEVDTMLLGARALGFNLDGAGVLDGQLLVEGDIGLDPETILSIGVEVRGNNVSSEPLLAPKGYSSQITQVSNRGGVFYTLIAPDATSVKLTFDSDVPSAWKTAFRSAIVEWNGSACIDISESSGSERIRISMNSGLSSSTIAKGMFPYKRQTGLIGRAPIYTYFPGTGIGVNPDFNGLSADAKLNTAIHELGHNLGFMHPGDGVLIPGTKTGNVGVMQTPLPSTPITSLSSDDIESRDIQYQKVDGKCPNGKTVVQL